MEGAYWLDQSSSKAFISLTLLQAELLQCLELKERSYKRMVTGALHCYNRTFISTEIAFVGNDIKNVGVCQSLYTESCPSMFDSLENVAYLE